MDLHRQEWAARVSLIKAIANSQTALSRILHSVADVAEQSSSKELAKKLCDNIQTLTTYQRALCQMAPGLRFKQRPKKGTPTKPWIHAASFRAQHATRGVQEEFVNAKNKRKKKNAKAKR
jgi:hypothetical protein